MFGSKFGLDGKAILVTGGAGSGVGRGVCEAVVEAGGTLLLNARSPEKAEKAAARYAGAVPVPGDISKEQDVRGIFETALRHCEGVSGLVNNAGIGLSRPAHEATAEQFDHLHAVDLRGVWMMCKEFIRQSIDRGQPGSMVNVSSVHAHSTMARFAIYAAAKGGMEALTRGLAVEYGERHIRCNAIAPGYVASEQNVDLIRTWSDDPEAWVKSHRDTHQAIPVEIQPADCGRLAVFLLSDASRCITGQVIRIDCGTTLLLYPKKSPADGGETHER